MRPGLTPEQFRAAGIYLNGGRKRGWRKHLARLLCTPEATIAAWASRSPSNARSIPGTAAVAIRLLVFMLQQREQIERNLVRASAILTEQVSALPHLHESAPPAPSVPRHDAVLLATMMDQSPVAPSPDAPSHLARGPRRPPEHAP